MWSVGGWSVQRRLVCVECGWVECAVKASACVKCGWVECAVKASACGVWVGRVCSEG